MTALDLDTLRERIRASEYPRGTPDQVAMWREDLAESRANLAIEDMDLNAEDEALFAIMLEEGLSPTAMVDVIHTLYRLPEGAA